MVSFKSIAVLAFAAFAAFAVAAPSHSEPELPYSIKKGATFNEIQEQVCGNNETVSCCNNESVRDDHSKGFIGNLFEGEDFVSGAQCETIAGNAGAAVAGAAVPVQNQQDQKCGRAVACCQRDDGNELKGLVPIGVEVNCNVIKFL